MWIFLIFVFVFSLVSSETVPEIMNRLDEYQKMGQLFGIELGSLLKCSDSQWKFDMMQLQVVVDMYCVGTVYVSSMMIQNAANTLCTKKVDRREISKLISEINGYYKQAACKLLPLIVWAPSYSAEGIEENSMFPFSDAKIPSGLLLAASGREDLVSKLASELASISRNTGFHVIETWSLQRVRRNLYGSLEINADLNLSFGDESCVISSMTSTLLGAFQNLSDFSKSSPLISVSNKPIVYNEFEIPGHEWADIYTSPWLPATLNVQPHDDVNFDEPNIDAGIDALAFEPSNPIFIDSGTWGRFSVPSSNVLLAASLYAHVSERTSQMSTSIWEDHSSSPLYFSDAYLSSEVFSTYRHSVASGISVFFVPRVSATTSLLLPSHKYLQDVLRGGNMRFGGLIIATSTDINNLVSIHVSRSLQESFIMLLSSAVDIHLMEKFDPVMIRKCNEIISFTKSDELKQLDIELKNLISLHRLNVTHIDVKIRRVIGLKRSLGLLDGIQTVPDIIQESSTRNYELISESIVLLRNFKSLLPIKNAGKFLLLHYSPSSLLGLDERVETIFINHFGKSSVLKFTIKFSVDDYLHHDGADSEFFSGSMNVSQLDYIKSNSGNFDYLVHIVTLPITSDSHFSALLYSKKVSFALNYFKRNVNIPAIIFSFLPPLFSPLNIFLTSSTILGISNATMLSFCAESECVEEMVKILIGESNPSGSLPIRLLSSSLYDSSRVPSSSLSLEHFNGDIPSEKFISVLPVGYGLSYATFELKSLNVTLLPAGYVNPSILKTSQPTPSLSVKFKIIHRSGPPGKIAVSVYGWILDSFPLPPDPFKLRSRVKSSFLMLNSEELLTVIIPASDFITSNEFGFASLQSGSIRIAVSVFPLEYYSKMNWFETSLSINNYGGILSLQDYNASWYMKQPKKLAPCVHYTVRKHGAVTDLMGVFLVITTLAGCFLGCMFKKGYEIYLNAKEKFLQKYEQVPFDPIARAARADAKRAAKKDLKSEVLANLDDGVGFSHDSQSKWSLFSNSRGSYTELSDRDRFV